MENEVLKAQAVTDANELHIIASILEITKGLKIMFIEEPSVRYEIINGKKVPVVECETEVVLRNKKKLVMNITNVKVAEDDIANPDTATQREHVTRSLKVKVAAMPPLGAASDEDKEE